MSLAYASQSSIRLSDNSVSLFQDIVYYVNRLLVVSTLLCTPTQIHLQMPHFKKYPSQGVTGTESSVQIVL
jgi:hypothetical protein